MSIGCEPSNFWFVLDSKAPCFLLIHSKKIFFYNYLANMFENSIWSVLHMNSHRRRMFDLNSIMSNPNLDDNTNEHFITVMIIVNEEE